MQLSDEGSPIRKSTTRIRRWVRDHFVGGVEVARDRIHGRRAIVAPAANFARSRSGAPGKAVIRGKYLPFDGDRPGRSGSSELEEGGARIAASHEARGRKK